MAIAKISLGEGENFQELLVMTLGHEAQVTEQLALNPGLAVELSFILVSAQKWQPSNWPMGPRSTFKSCLQDPKTPTKHFVTFLVVACTEQLFDLH